MCVRWSVRIAWNTTQNDFSTTYRRLRWTNLAGGFLALSLVYVVRLGAPRSTDKHVKGTGTRFALGLSSSNRRFGFSGKNRFHTTDVDFVFCALTSFVVVIHERWA